MDKMIITGVQRRAGNFFRQTPMKWDVGKRLYKIYNTFIKKNQINFRNYLFYMLKSDKYVKVYFFIKKLFKIG